MASSLRRLRGFSRFLYHCHSGNLYLQSRQGTDFIASFSIPSGHGRIDINGSFMDRGFHAQRFSTVTETSQESILEDDILSFIKSTFDDLEGPCHCWLNKLEDGKDLGGKNDVFLVLVDAFLVDSLASGCNAAALFEKVKSLQQRYPKLHVIGFQSSSSIFSEAMHVHFTQTTMEKYITFPILLSSKDFPEVAGRECFILFKGFESPFLRYEGDVDVRVIDRAVKELMQQNGSHRVPNNLKSTWVKQAEVIKEPHACSSLQNLLLHFPGCISVDERGNRLFLSDINHHRVIIFDGSGKILDCIGSSPGFEDGDFESAKLMRPAASLYHATEDCLYFVDSENHAVRRADMERRVVETLYPSCSASKSDTSLWRWIVNKFWMERDVDKKSEKLDSEAFLFPWHLIESLDNDIYVINQSFGTLWIMDLASGVIKETVKGYSKILEICGQMILEKSLILKQIPCGWLQQEVGFKWSLDCFPYAGPVSSLATFQDHIVICDTVGQRVLRLGRESGIASSFSFSNFGILGLPYWAASHLERVYVLGDASSGVHTDHIESFSLLPGRVDIQLNVDLPQDTELLEPLQEGCVWRQARGAATEVSGAESIGVSSEKVGVAQQWYDEIDHLVLSTPEEVELSTEEENTSQGNVHEGGVCIDCAVCTSPGTSQVIIFAALYLKLKRNPDANEDAREKRAARIADILNPKRAKGIERDPCFHFLMKSNRDLEEVVFMKPLHVKLNFDCRDHPKADNSKDIILTDSSLEVNVSLK